MLPVPAPTVAAKGDGRERVLRISQSARPRRARASRGPSAARERPSRLHRLTPGEVPKGYAALAERLMVRAQRHAAPDARVRGLRGRRGEHQRRARVRGEPRRLRHERPAGRRRPADVGPHVGHRRRRRRPDARSSAIGRRPRPREWGRGKLTIVPSPKASHAGQGPFLPLEGVRGVAGRAAAACTTTCCSTRRRSCISRTGISWRGCATGW